MCTLQEHNVGGSKDKGRRSRTSRLTHTLLGWERTLTYDSKIGITTGLIINIIAYYYCMRIKVAAVAGSGRFLHARLTS